MKISDFKKEEIKFYGNGANDPLLYSPVQDGCCGFLFETFYEKISSGEFVKAEIEKIINEN